MSPQHFAAARPNRADARRNHERILEVAAELFSRNGVNTSLDEIAREAGVGPGTLYRHFPTREDLLAAALDNHGQTLERTAERLLNSGAPGSALLEWMRAVARHASIFGGLPDSVLRARRECASPLFISCEGITASMRQLLLAAQEAGEIRPDITADDLFVITNAVAWAVNQGNLPPSDVDRLLGLMTTGLLASR